MIFTLLLSISLFTPRTSFASVPDDGSPPRFSGDLHRTFGITPPANPDPGACLSVIALMCERSGMAEIPSEVSAFVRDMAEQGGNEDRFQAYATGLEFALTPSLSGGLGHRAHAAHVFAVDLSARRANFSAVQTELNSYSEFFSYLSGPLTDGGLALVAEEARVIALDFARLVPNEGAEQLYLSDEHGMGIGARFAMESSLLNEWREKRGKDPLGAGQKLALLALLQVRGPGLVTHELKDFSKALAFCLKLPPDSGLGSSFGDAKTKALEILDCGNGTVGGFMKSYHELFEGLSSPGEEGGFGFSEIEARRMAFDLTEKMDHASRSNARDLLGVLRGLRSFSLTSIREGGLGHEKFDFDSGIEKWMREMPIPAAIETYRSYYRLAMSTFLHQGARNGNYDEISARDSALSLLDSLKSLPDMFDWFKSNGFELRHDRALPAPPYQDFPRFPKARAWQHKIRKCVAALKGSS